MVHKALHWNICASIFRNVYLAGFPYICQNLFCFLLKYLILLQNALIIVKVLQ